MLASDSLSHYALAIETSSAIGSIALGLGDRLLGSMVFTQPRAHAVEFFPAIESLCRTHGLAPNQLGSVYVSSGPGSFTGLRIGITAARTFALALRVTVIPIPTLAVVAENAASVSPAPAHLCVLLDAKRGHVYAAAFRQVEVDQVAGGAHYRAISGPVEADPRAFLVGQPPDTAVMGEGVLYHRRAIEESGLRILPESIYRPQAETVLRLGYAHAAQGPACDWRTLTPTYIRPPEAEEKWTQKR